MPRTRRRFANLCFLLLVTALTAACSRPQPLAGGTVLPTPTPTASAAEGANVAADAPPADSTAAPATPAPPDPGVLSDTALAMQNYLTSLTDNGQFMGTVLVAQNSELVLVGGFGLADVEIPLPASPEQRYRIGSLTKQFTAAAILRLQEQGLVDVSSPLSAYLPDYPNADRITVHQLLTHTSGIPDYERLPVYMATIDQPVTTQELLDRFAELPLQFRPGERFAYSSSNYMVLTRIIEVVSGKSYGAFLHDEFFAPLYMTKTGLDTGDVDAPDRARGYIIAGEQLGPARAMDMSIPSGAGALVSNVYDLYGWMQALQFGVALDPASVALLFTPYVAMETGPGEAPAAYGYGWIIDEHLGRERIWHPGHIFGFAATVAAYPTEDATIVVLSNIEGTQVRRIQEELAQILFQVP